MGCKVGKLQSLFHGVDVLQPMLTIFQMTGSLPINIKWKTDRNGFKYICAKPNKFYFNISVVLLAITIIHTAWAPTMLLKLEKSITTKLTKTMQNTTKEQDQINSPATAVKILHPLFICITSLTGRTLSITTLPNRIPRLISTLNRIDEILSVPSELYRSNASAVLSSVLALIALNIPIMAYHLWQLSFYHSVWGSAWEAFSMFNIFATYSVEFQFMILCYVARTRLAYINRKLAELAADEFVRRTRTTRRRINIEVLSSILKIDLSKGVSRRVSHSVRSLRSGHILLNDIMDEINGTYQLHILVSVFSSIAKILFNIYFSIFGFIAATKQLPETVQRTQFYIVCAWTVYYCLRFLSVVVVAHITSSESAKTKAAFVKIDWRMFDEPERDEIKMFWEHLSGRDFEFSACGLFNLNMALITSTFSSGITYLVIMAQLHS